MFNQSKFKLLPSLESSYRVVKITKSLCVIELQPSLYALIETKHSSCSNNWDKVFKNEPSKICGRQSLKIFTWSILEYFISFNPFCPDPRRRAKINLNFYFHTSLWCLKRFYEGLKGLHKTF